MGPAFSPHSCEAGIGSANRLATIFAMLPCTRITLAICTAASAVWIAPVAGAPDDPADRLVPAEFPDAVVAGLAPKLLDEFSDDFELIVYCLADIESHGQVTWNYCIPYDNFDDLSIRNAINKHMADSAVTPATIDGETDALQIYYRVSIDRTRIDSPVELYQNWGHDDATWGRHYTSPQRFNLDNRYPSGCLFFRGISRTRINARAHIVSRTEFDREASEWRRARKCKKNIRRELSESRYIPGYFDGKPVETTHVEIWGSVDDFRLTLPERE